MKHLSLLGTGFYDWNSYYDLFWVFIFELNTTWYEFCLNWHSMLLNNNSFEYHCSYSYCFIILAKETWWALYKLWGSSLSLMGLLDATNGVLGSHWDSHWGSNGSNQETIIQWMPMQHPLMTPTQNTMQNLTIALTKHQVKYI